MNKKLIKMCIVSWILLALASCSNEVDVIGLWKDIPVVYGIVNRTDSAHYLRIERAYLPPNRSALDVAKDVDSLYFDPNEFTVELFILHPSDLDTLPWQEPVERVDLRNEGIVRDQGIFQHEPAYAYKTKDWRNAPMLLKMTNQKTGNIFWSRTESIRSDNSLLLLTPNYSKKPQRPLAWRETSNAGDEIFANLTIDVQNGFGAIYDYKFRFHYDEYEVDAQGNEITSTRVDKSIEWRAVSDFIPTSAAQNKQTVNGEAFYSFLASNLSDVTGSNLRRCAGYLEVYAVGGSASIKDYVLARKANEGFVGGLYPSEPYSNIVGGFGFFGSSDVLQRKDRPGDPRLMHMSPLSYEYLSRGELTNMLGFESVSPCF